jgi:hypothetical protein
MKQMKQMKQTDFRLDVTKGKRQTKRDQDQGGVPGNGADHTILSLIKQDTASDYSESINPSHHQDRSMDGPQHSKRAASS